MKSQEVSDKSSLLKINTDSKDLKLKVMKEVECLLAKMQKGYLPDFQFILSEIQIIDMLSQDLLEEQFSLYALQFYLNNRWEI